MTNNFSLIKASAVIEDRIAVPLGLALGVAIFSASLVIALTPFFANACLCFDDAYIYLSAARNMQHLHGPVLNVGDQHTVATSGLWALLLATALDFAGPNGALEQRLSLLTATLLGLAALANAVRLRNTIGAFAWLSPIAVFSTPLMAIAVGMESALAICAASLASALIAEGRRPILCGLTIGIGYLARAEIALFAPLAMLAFGVRYKWFDFAALKRDRRIVLQLVVSTAVIPLLWHTTMLTTVGEFLPSTLSAKLAQSSSETVPLYRNFVVDALHTALFGKWWLAGLMLIGAVAGRRVLWPLIAFWIGHVLLYVLINAPYYAWYNYDTWFVVRLLLFVGATAPLFWLLRRASVFGNRVLGLIPGVRTSATGAMTAAAFTSAGALLALAATPVITRSVPNFWPERGQLTQIASYRKVADFIAQTAAKGDVVLGPEIGTLSYLMPDQVLRDTNGLATPRVPPETMFEWQSPHDRYAPRYLVPMFDAWGDVVTFPNAMGGIDSYRRAFVAEPNAAGGVRSAPVYVLDSTAALPALSLPVHLKFLLNSADSERLSLDWGQAEIGAWSNGYRRRLILPMDKAISNYDIVIVTYPMVEGPIGPQRMVILQDGVPVYEKTMDEPQPYAHTFPGRDGVDKIDLTFETPDAEVPAARGVGPGLSRIAVMLMELEVRPRDPAL